MEFHTGNTHDSLLYYMNHENHEAALGSRFRFQFPIMHNLAFKCII